jgi:hypothetical protein
MVSSTGFKGFSATNCKLLKGDITPGAPTLPE